MKTLALAVLLGSGGSFAVSAAQDHTIATFSIVARDPASGELGVAVASRFFAAWNEGWTAFTEKRFAEALVAQERAVKLQPDLPELVYDLAVIRLAAGHRAEALEALERALKLNPKLKKQAAADSDLAALRDEAKFRALIAN